MKGITFSRSVARAAAKMRALAGLITIVEAKKGNIVMSRQKVLDLIADGNYRYDNSKTEELFETLVSLSPTEGKQLTLGLTRTLTIA